MDLAIEWVDLSSHISLLDHVIQFIHHHKELGHCRWQTINMEKSISQSGLSTPFRNWFSYLPIQFIISIESNTFQHPAVCKRIICSQQIAHFIFISFLFHFIFISFHFISFHFIFISCSFPWHKYDHQGGDHLCLYLTVQPGLVGVGTQSNP